MIRENREVCVNMCINEKWLNNFTLTLHINSSAICNTYTCITVGEAMCSQTSAFFSAKSLLTQSLSTHVKCFQQFVSCGGFHP